jgi:hypothetical protein
VLRRTALPKNSPAMPADVRKAFGLPEICLLDLGYAQFIGANPKFIMSRSEAQSASAHQAAEPPG